LENTDIERLVEKAERKLAKPTVDQGVGDDAAYVPIAISALSTSWCSARKVNRKHTALPAKSAERLASLRLQLSSADEKFAQQLL
jgi:hypothetical protein